MKDKKNKISTIQELGVEGPVGVGTTSSSTSTTLNNLSSATTSVLSSSASTTTFSSPYTTSSSTVGYYSYGDDNSYEWTIAESKMDISDEGVKKIIEKIFDSDEDLLPLVKNYLIKYLDKVMDEPDEIVKELVKEKDEEIAQLKEKVDDLTKKVEELEKRSYGDINIGGYRGDWDHLKGDWTIKRDYDNISIAPYSSSPNWTVDNTTTAISAIDTINNTITDYSSTANNITTTSACSDYLTETANFYNTLTTKMASRLNALNTTDAIG